MKNRIVPFTGSATVYRLTVGLRICDIAGWVDIRASGHGKILNFSVLCRAFGEAHRAFRGIRITVDSTPVLQVCDSVMIIAADPNFDTFETVANLKSGNFDHSNLLLAGLSLIDEKYLTGKNTEISIDSPVKPGASMGTSACVLVGVIKGVTRNQIDNDEVARLAFQAESEVMRRETGTQDQKSAAFDYPVKFIEIDEYPHTTCRPVDISAETIHRLEEGMITINYGGGHNSSDVHHKVIKKLHLEGQESPRLERFRGLSKTAEECLLTGDLVGFGKVMQDNTLAQMQLCAEPEDDDDDNELVCRKAQGLIRLANNHHALGWKVNGAGGKAGTLTVLHKDRVSAERFHKDCLVYFSGTNYEYFEHVLYPLI